MGVITTVGELIDALEGYDHNLPVAIRATSSGCTSANRAEDASGIPLAIEVDDIYYSNRETATKNGYDAIVCIVNKNPADMVIG